MCIITLKIHFNIYIEAQSWFGSVRFNYCLPVVYSIEISTFVYISMTADNKIYFRYHISVHYL